MPSAEKGLRQVWGWRDRRTGQRVSVSTTNTREQAERELAGWWRRDRLGKRPDLHDLMPHIEVFQIQPGDPEYPPRRVIPPGKGDA